MDRKRMRAMAVSSSVMLAAALVVLAVATTPAAATPATGVTSLAIAQGSFLDIDTKVKTGDWKADLLTKGASDLFVLQNTIQPGGSFGWHSHPGPSLVIVKSGTATLYFGADPSCTPHVVTAGNGFVDSGGDVHVVRNEGSEALVTIVTSLVPQGATRRIDQPDPGNCGF